jgi:putative pyruvate formate lyase activating enzyme
MPGEIAGTESIMRFLAHEISRDTYVNVMSQYHPAGRVSAAEFREINHRISTVEYDHALEAARRAGLWRIEAERPHWPQ